MLGIGFNHFWHAPSEDHGGDLLYIQGHSSPGIYARAFLEGRLTEEQLLNFRREVDGKGLSSYPHPKLMPNFWQFPTVSMGLGPLMAIYQARFLKYLHARGIADTDNRKVWVFCGDGEMDEPESMGAIGMAAREKLDNLVMVVNCNLQRLDGPVRGNGKIIQELEADFRGAGWNVVKVIWGPGWDALLAKDKDGILQRVMMETVDGEYQNYKAKDGAYVRKHFFGKHPELLKMVANMTDDDIWRLTRGGHDPHKIYAAFKNAQENKGSPTVLLVKTVKGFGMGKSGEARNTAHQTKKLDDEAIREMRDRFAIPIPDDKLAEIPFFKPSDDAPEIKYLHERRKALGGYLPQRREQADEKLPVPPLSTFKAVLDPTAEGREISTTQAYVRILTTLLKDPSLGQRIVPILVDESRTFGMEGLFRQIGIFNQQGQLYEPVDKDQVMYYREDKAGQILQEGINEAGGMCSWIAAATSYSTNNRVMIPFYTFYSMFGMQRVGDLAWAGRRHARPRLPDGRHRRPHHAERRRPAARRRPQPHHRGDHPELHSVRPDLRARSGGDHPGRPAPHGGEAGRRVLLHHHHERELRAAGPEARPGRGHPQGHVPAAGRRQERQAARAADGLRHHPARVDVRRRTAEERLGHRRRRLVLPVAHAAGPRRPGRRALEPVHPDRGSRACRT